MTDTPEDEQAREILKVVNAINDAWVRGEPDAIGERVHDRIAVAGPDGAIMAEGRDACVESYRAFINAAAIRAFESSGHEVRVWGDSAVASYRFSIRYEMDGETHRDLGRDTFVLIRDADRWLAVWRTMHSG